jgi:hypothetical protein
MQMGPPIGLPPPWQPRRKRTTKTDSDEPSGRQLGRPRPNILLLAPGGSADQIIPAVSPPRTCYCGRGARTAPT